MARSPKTEKPVELEVFSFKQETVSFPVVGITPFYCNRVSEKARRELLFPRGRMTAATKKTNLKHEPMEEYRNSAYRRLDSVKGPTRIEMRAEAFKGAIAQAAIDMPTAVAKAQINRLSYVEGSYVPIWGIPRLNMDIVRSSDQARTPDVRTRARIDRWASLVTVKYVVPMLSGGSVATLLQAAGTIIGVGDFRQEKGKGNFGLFRVCEKDDAEFLEIVASGGTAVQDAAFANPECSDAETESLLAWFDEERKRRASGKPSNDDTDPDEPDDALSEAAD